MEPADPLTDQEKKLKDLEQELNDLRQGLTLVADYYRDIEEATRQQDASETIDEELLKPLVDDDLEFEGIWKFHEEILIADPAARVPCTQMYEAFVRFCKETGRQAVEQDAFEFVFSRMQNPEPACDRGEWTGYRLRSAGN
ncbi:hypothetical protein [uncultured Methanoregula sp.]|uniref:hypothetical protein n=1 Tax=uncultured Methanoregula sp. TaxID=1005933 RepID=UPI002AAAE703|nr:hypothetical protein [uncultured Methanoregula sp.]